MKKKGLIWAYAVGCILAVAACNSSKNDMENTTDAVTTTAFFSDDDTDDKTLPSEVPTTKEVIGIEDPSTEIIVTLEASTSGSDARLDTVNAKYEKGNVSITYPQLVGLHNDASEQSANEALKKNILSVLEHYEVDEEKDTLEISYTTITLYRGQISVLYLGSLKHADSVETIHLCMTDNINLISGKPIRLNSRYSTDGIKKMLCTEKSYEILSANTMNIDALKDYLANQPDSFYKSILEDGDFGGQAYPSAFSYSNGSTLHIIIQVPHILGDYVELSVIQKTK